MDLYTKQCFAQEPELKKRLSTLQTKFKKLYGDKEGLVIRSPGRAEIIGNHTDYNQGYALSSCISQSILALFKKRTDNKIRIFSQEFSRHPVEFLITNAIACDLQNSWTNYARGVAQQLLKAGFKISGADILLDSNVPMGSGVSTSAAYELVVGLGLLSVSRLSLDNLNLALLCQKAENLFVGSPCGFLDQGSIAFGKSGKMVFMDFLAKKESPVSKVSLIPADLGKDVSFVVAVDKTAKRELGSSGYPARRKMCEESLPFWSKVLKRNIKSLRFVSVSEFEKFKSDLEKYNPVMRKRAEHIIYENERVLKAVKMLKTQKIKDFGKLLTEAGKSALDLYELDEKTPELTYLYKFGQTLNGVLGIRNMGGGFSATILALVENAKMSEFEDKLASGYKNKFKGNLDFIEFKVTNGVGIIQF